jgi:hypothetical protein
VEPWLDAFRTGELAEADRVRVERHLERCDACARRLAELEVFASAVGRGFRAGIAGGAIPEPDWGAQRRAILERTVGPRPARQRAIWLRYAPQVGLAVLALVVLGVLVREGVRGPADLERRLEKSPLKSMEGAPSAASARGAAGKAAPVSPAPTDRTSAAAEGAEGKELERGAAGAWQGEPRPRGAAGNAAPEVAGFATPPAGGREADLAKAEPQAAPPPEEAPPFPSVEKAPPGEEPQAAAGPGAPRMDVLQRLDFYARRALASGDSLVVGRALAFWRDSVAGRTDLDPGRKRAAAALVDTLAGREAERRRATRADGAE